MMFYSNCIFWTLKCRWYARGSYLPSSATAAAPACAAGVLTVATSARPSEVVGATWDSGRSPCLRRRYLYLRSQPALRRPTGETGAPRLLGSVRHVPVQLGAGPGRRPALQQHLQRVRLPAGQQGQVHQLPVQQPRQGEATGNRLPVEASGRLRSWYGGGLTKFREGRRCDTYRHVPAARLACKSGMFPHKVIEIIGLGVIFVPCSYDNGRLAQTR